MTIVCECDRWEFAIYDKKKLILNYKSLYIKNQPTNQPTYLILIFDGFDKWQRNVQHVHLIK